MKKKISQRTTSAACAMMTATAQSKKGGGSLDTSEEKYRILFEGMLQGAFFQAADGTLVDVNSKALQIFGLTRRMFLNCTSCSPSWDVIREDGSSLPGQEHPSMIALKTGRPVKDKIVGVFNQKTKAYVWLVVNAIPQFSPGERTPRQVYVTLHDITERRQAQEVLRQSEERYRMLTETAPDAIITTNGQGRIVSWNHGAEKIYGYKAEEAIGRDCALIMAENQREHHDKIFDLLIKAGKPLTSDTPMEGLGRRRDGSIFTVEQSYNLHWANNEPFFTTIVRDISERKQIENKLYESEELFRLNFENAPIGILIFNKHGVLLKANRYCEQCFGHSRQDLREQGFSSFLHPEDRNKTRAILGAGHESMKQLRVIENRYFAEDGRTIYTKQHIQGVFDAAGELVFITVLTEDITPAKKLSLLNSSVVKKLKDVHSHLNELCSMLPEEQNFSAAKSLDDYGLSPMESRIASMIFHGSSNKGIARNFNISENTVKHHATSIYNKLTVKNRIQFINFIRTNRILI